MFETLSQSLMNVFDQITKRGSLTEADVTTALKEVRRALLEADVALEVVRPFIDRVRTKAVGKNLIKSVKPGEMVIKIVHDALVDVLGQEAVPISLEAPAPVVMMMVGLQGAGKTTTTAKLAVLLAKREKRRVLMASLDVKRPAAQEQLAILGRQIEIETLPIIAGETPVQIAKRAQETALKQGFDVVLLDTAGRTHIDAPLMQEMEEIKTVSNPHEILLVADSLTGQDAVHLAKNFHESVNLTGIILTRMDGDGRGGAALSMRAATGQPIKLIGVGEKVEDLDVFDPNRIAQRILGMGDIVSLVEKAARVIEEEQALEMSAKMRKGIFTLEDFATQLGYVEKMGGISAMMNLMPGMGTLKDKLPAGQMDDRKIKGQRAIIMSMTPYERRNPDILKASRKKRIAAGAGAKVEEVNRLLKQHRQMADMMKAMNAQSGKRGIMGGLGQMLGFGGGGGMPGVSQAELDALKASIPQGGAPAQQDTESLLKGLSGSNMPFPAPGLGAGMPNLKGGLLPDLKKMGLGGLNPFKMKPK